MDLTWDREPTLTGPSARAWQWELGEIPSDKMAIVDQWLIHQPGSHPFWSWYVLGMIQLRDVAGVDPPARHFPGAAYEVLVVSLDPDQPVPEPEGVPGTGGRHPLRTLQPVDQCHQFGFLPGGDKQAHELCMMFARAVCDGFLVCDVDHRRAWASSIATTYEHITTGGHAR